MHICIHTHIHTYICIYAYTHTHACMQVVDHTTINNVVSLLGMTSSYLDVDHFFSSGDIDPSKWAAQKGKCVLMFDPRRADCAVKLPLQRLAEHIQVRLCAYIYMNKHAQYMRENSHYNS